MNYGEAYETGWATCTKCNTRRPQKHIGADGVCSDGWCERKALLEPVPEGGV